LFKENEVNMTVKEKSVELKNGKSKYNIGMDTFPSDYPMMKLGAPDSEIAMHQFFLKQAFDYTAKFVNEKNPQPQMIGINMREKNNRIIFTGLDGQIMCQCAVKPISINQWNPIVTPTETAKKVNGLLEDKGEINVTHSVDKIMFYTSADSPEKYEVMSVLSNNKYPNSDVLFKNKTPENLVVNTLEMMDAIKRLNLYTFDDTAPIVVMKTNPDNINELILTAQDDLTNKDGEEMMTVVNATGKQIHKAYNADYLLKVLSSIDENEFVFFYNEDHTKPSFMEPKIATESESAFNFLVSAIKL
jgi:DNA polymerase III sliding clamp (beta) subunit (PCNA family)